MQIGGGKGERKKKTLLVVGNYQREITHDISEG